jgi:hypothetical protein
MTDQEISSKVATDVMGWEFRPQSRVRGEGWYIPGDWIGQKDWHPTTSLEQAHEVARKVVELSSPETFLIPLLQAQGESMHLEPYGSYWNIFNATPRQICEAALLAIKKAQEEEVK